MIRENTKLIAASVALLAIIMLLSTMGIGKLHIESVGEIDIHTISFQDGSGTVYDPYLIYDVDDLQAMKDDLSAHYALANDIDASETRNWNNGAGFEPIGENPLWPDYGTPFTGSLDGRDRMIYGLYIGRVYAKAVGLFGFVDENSEIRSTGIFDAEIIGEDYVGNLVGYNRGTISNSYATGIVKGLRDIGGLVGRNEGTVSGSYATGNVSDGSNVGGLVGNNFATVLNSYASVDVIGRSWVGGLVGYNWGGTVSNSYATGNVTGDSGVGGLVGSNGGIVNNSYATGNVTGYDQWPITGGLIGGDRDGTVSNSFYDIITTGQSDRGKGDFKTTPELIDITTFIDAGWDITPVADPDTRNTGHIWNIVDAETYPFLSWQEDVFIPQDIDYDFELPVDDDTYVIRIDGNSDFAAQAAAEGWPGDGSEGDPYVIEGYEIDGTGHGYGIYVGNTTVHFVVRGCYVHNVTGKDGTREQNTGVYLYKVQNGRFEDNILYNKFGFVLRYSKNNLIHNNTITAIGCIRLWYSDYNTISSNYVFNSGDERSFAGISLLYSEYNLLAYNHISGFKLGIDVTYDGTYGVNEYRNNTFVDVEIEIDEVISIADDSNSTSLELSHIVIIILLVSISVVIITIIIHKKKGE